MPKNIPSQIQELETKLQQLKEQQVNELRERLRLARKTVSELEDEIAAITGKTAVPRARKRVSSEEMRSRIVAVLSANPKGLTQKQIADETQFAYGSVAAFLKKHQKEFKTTGERKQKRYFLK
jgi:DNA-binding NarL/FixJ family response regulator